MATLVALLMGLVLAVLPVAGTQAAVAPGTATNGRTRAEAAARVVDESDPLEVVIRRLTPSTIPDRGKDEITVSGRIVNRSDSTWSGLSVYLLTSFAPITTPTDLLAAQQSDPRLELGGDRLITPGLYEEVPDLAPGDSTRFTITVTRDDLEISGDSGVYWLSVQVLGSGDEGRLEGADGRARTFIPLVPEDTPTTSLALGLQFRNHVVRAPTGELQFLPTWQQTFTKDGRFGRLVRMSRTSGEFPLTWVVDPAVLQAAESVAQGNPATTLTADPGQTAEEKASAAGDDAPTDEADLPAEARIAARWLQDFDRDANGHTVLGLPFADLDVSAADRAGADALVSRSLQQSTDVLDARGISSRPVVSPLSGYLSPQAATDLDPRVPALLSTSAAPDVAATGAPVAERTTGGRVVVVPSRTSLFQPQPSDETSALGVRQSLLAQVALHALSPVAAEQPMAVLLPPSWDPGSAWREAKFFRGLDLPWIQPGSLTGLLDRETGDVQVDPERLVIPDSEVERELPAYLVASVQRVLSATVTLQELLTEESTIGDRLDEMALLGTSSWSRRFPGVAAERARAVRGQIRSWLGQVQVRGPSFVTMSSETGRFPITIVNGLDQPVTVGLRTSVSGGSLEVVTPGPVELAPGGRQALRIEATSSDIGIHQVRIQPVTSSGKVLGQGTTLSVRSSRVGLIVWVIMAVGAGFLFIAIAIRLTRRISRHLRRQRSGAAA